MAVRLPCAGHAVESNPCSCQDLQVRHAETRGRTLGQSEQSWEVAGVPIVGENVLLLRLVFGNL